MALEIRTEIEINATPQKVWQILTNFEDYPNWNPFIKSIEGNLAIGNKIKALIAPPGGSEMTFKPTILTLEKHKELSWMGHLLFPGIFDGKHKFELIENQDGTTTFIQSEIFKGILVPLFKNQLNINTKNGFIAMNETLKKIVEE